MAMLGDWMVNLAVKVSDIANKGDVDILVYSGDKDFICNWRGGEAWTLNMDCNTKMTSINKPTLTGKIKLEKPLDN